MNLQLSKIPAVRAFLLDISIYDHLEEIAYKYKIPEDRIGEFLKLTDAVVKSEIKLSQMPGFITQAFGVDENIAKKISADLSGYALLPLEEFIPGITQHIKSWGGKVSDYPELRIEREKYTTDKLLKDYAAEIGLELPEHLMKRFVFLSKGYLTKERAREATKTLLMRPLNIGGLGLLDGQAEGVFAKLDKVDLSEAEDREEGEKESEKGEKSERSEKGEDGDRRPETGDWGEDVMPPALPPPEIEMVMPPTLPPPDVSITTPDPSPPLTLPVENQVKSRTGGKSAVQIPNKKDALSVLSTKLALTREVPLISGSLFEDREEQEVKEHDIKLQKQLKRLDPVDVSDYAGLTNQVTEIFKSARQSKKSASELVDKYMRGMLDKNQALSLLEDKYRLHIDQANKVLDILEAQKKDNDEKIKTSIIQRDSQKKSESNIVAKEKEVLEMRHAALTQTMANEEVQPVIASARVSASRTKDEEIEIQKSKIDQTKITEAQKTKKPKPATVQLSIQSTAPSETGDRRLEARVSDVRFKQKLVGPVDELGTMSVADFRRLSSDPKEATRKISDSFKLLEEVMYEERVRGIAAWRLSPVNQLYLQMSTEALMQGVSITEVASSRRNKGDEALSPAEIGAIVELNSSIKF